MNLYVGNLSYGATEDELAEEFKKVGNVASAKIITDRFSGKSRGFGFVEMATAEDGEKAISALNGKDFKGRALVVNQARVKN